MRTLACVLVLALASAAPAAAQSRFTIWINGAYQAAPQDFGEQFEFTYRDDVSEQATAIDPAFCGSIQSSIRATPSRSRT